MVQLRQSGEFIARGTIIRMISPDSIPDRESEENKALLPVVCHWFVGHHTFIAGKRPEQTQQPGADVFILMGEENEEEKL